MVIRASSGRQVEPLIADLASPSAVTRDGAVARLIVIGARATRRLMAAAEDRAAAPETRIAALQALEGIGDAGTFEAAAAALDDPDERIAAASVGVLHALLRSARGVDVLDRLSAVVLDRGRPRAVRLAAIRVVGELGAATVGPLFQALESDPDTAIAMAAGIGPRAAGDPTAILRDAAAGALPDAPGALRVALSEAAATAPDAVLQQTIERVRFREGAETGPARAEWTAVRAAAHAALADRGSRAALYDLRETFESAREPLPVEFLGAVSAIGDTSCLEAVAAAYGRALESGARLDDWWCQRLVDVFRTIATREGVTRRHAAGKRIATRWREAAALLWP